MQFCWKGMGRGWRGFWIVLHTFDETTNLVPPQIAAANDACSSESIAMK